MTRLRCKEVKFVWDEKCELSFQILKEKLTTTPVLTLLYGNEDFIIYHDTSKLGLGRVSMQRGNMVLYSSRQLKLYEQNYGTHDLKLTVVVFELKLWRHYL